MSSKENFKNKPSEEYSETAQSYYNYMMKVASPNMELALSKEGKLVPKNTLTSVLTAHLEAVLELEAKGDVVKYDQQELKEDTDTSV